MGIKNHGKRRGDSKLESLDDSRFQSRDITVTKSLQRLGGSSGRMGDLSEAD